MNTSAHPWLAPATNGSTAQHDAAPVLPYRALLVRCATHWRLGLALLALSGLLLAFEHVVREGMRQGDLRRIAVATHANDQWRCSVISQRAQRDSCRALLTTVAAEGAVGAQARPDETLRR